MSNGSFEKLIEGRIKDGETLDGYGTMFYDIEKTTYYQGNWRDGLKHGTGTLVCIACNPNYTYIGDWENDKMHGFGKIIYPGTGYYEGEIWNNRYEGSGKFVFDTGKIFDGTYANNKRWKGHLTLPAKGNCGQKETKIEYRNGETWDGTHWVTLKDNPIYQHCH